MKSYLRRVSLLVLMLEAEEAVLAAEVRRDMAGEEVALSDSVSLVSEVSEVMVGEGGSRGKESICRPTRLGMKTRGCCVDVIVVVGGGWCRVRVKLEEGFLESFFEERRREVLLMAEIKLMQLDKARSRLKAVGLQRLNARVLSRVADKRIICSKVDRWQGFPVSFRSQTQTTRSKNLEESKRKCCTCPLILQPTAAPHILYTPPPRAAADVVSALS
ncbi:hypothetical protein EJ06DRAFT_32941 [Trichodelitschia bisporula]|uniref:Uncharacterized protein n=1 Tax=Trichodelitschia bisporula TaxID=703511 RepID=A0A6G1HUX8_9PEZI|nr:hypothetical protein EJ06DRAFT_32941 [Trichodelitschia bisporula]